ncbi:MAG: M50 family metallopeptidase [Chroococcales cyanobacterium]
MTFSKVRALFSPAGNENQIGVGWLLTAAIATIILWQVPWGDYILYPFSILATWFHEMGHGLTAIAFGGDFERLVLFSNGSGVAYHSGSLFLGRIGRAMVAAGGPLGPAIAGSFFIISSRRYKEAHFCLIFLGCLLIASVLLWVRSLFGIVAILLWGLTILAIALKAPQWLQGWTIQFLGVQACISIYHSIDYLLMNQASIGGRIRISDTGQIAKQLFLPHWFWASLIIALSIYLLWKSIAIAYQLPKIRK